MTLLDFHTSSVAEHRIHDKSFAIGHCRVVTFITNDRKNMTYVDYLNKCSEYGVAYANGETFNAYKAQQYAY